MHPSHILTQREIIRNSLNKSDWETTKDKCDSTRAHRRHLAANGKHENKRKIYCTNVHLRIIEILITLMYNLSAVTAAVTRGLYSTLPIPHCANSVLYVDYTGMPKFGRYDFALVVTCGLTRFTRVFPCTKHITGKETIKILLEEWFCVYGAPKEINSDKDV